MADVTNNGGDVTPATTNNNANVPNATGTNQNQNSSTGVDYNKIQEIITDKNSRTEESILKGYLQKQGLSPEEMETAISSYKENKIKAEQLKSQEVQTLQTENAQLLQQIQTEKLNTTANQCALELGLDPKIIVSVLKLADMSKAVDDKGEISKEEITTALNKVLEDLPQLKSSNNNSSNGGFVKIGADNSGSSNNANDQLKEIFKF